MLNPFTLHPRTAPPELEVFPNGGSSWLELHAVLNSKHDVRAQALFRATLGPNRKKPVSLQHCIQGVQQIRADEECPWILEQGQHYNILSPGQRRIVVCAGDSVLKFTKAGGHGQEAVISEAL